MGGKGCRPVHPRVCGEQSGNNDVAKPVNGSSPRVRGTAHTRVFVPESFAVHPRVCGEQDRSIWLVQFLAGSSPRVRGTETQSITFTQSLRFIPACAGNSIFDQCGEVLAPVHPRVCGEQPHVSLSASSRTGSSPRVRGTDLQANRALRRERFIPACAGNSIGILFQ